MSKVKIKVFDNKIRFLKYLINNNICYSYLEKYDGYYILVVNYDSYRSIRRMYKCEIVKYYGKENIINYLNFHKYMLISFVFSMIVLFLLSNTIFDVRINTDDKNIEKIIRNSLYKNNIYKYRSIKSFNDIKNIKNNTLKENEELIEWIEIKRKGSVYIVDVSKRIKNDTKNNNGVSSIYASHNGVIKYISVERGTRVREINEYVSKGDLIISGNILKDNVVVDKVNALGKVYGEVWYTVNVSIPFEYTEYIKTGKIINHYYLDIFGKEFTLTGKYDSDNVISKKQLLVDKPYLFFKLYKEVKEEYKYNTYYLSNSDAVNLAIKRSEEEINNTLEDDEYVISKKVLKKEVNSSKMDVEVFFKVYERLGVTSNIDIMEESSEGSN